MTFILNHYTIWCLTHGIAKFYVLASISSVIQPNLVDEEQKQIGIEMKGEKMGKGGPEKEGGEEEEVNFEEEESAANHLEVAPNPEYYYNYWLALLPIACLLLLILHLRWRATN